jgi:hypothetical protein
MKHFFSLSTYLRVLLALLLSAFVLTGCSSSSEDDSETQNKLSISLTDAEGDFTHYTVDVTALKLYRANGAVVETLPNTTTLDFAQYVEVSEFLTTATVPNGFYTKAEITLDYSNADIQVENAEGDSIAATAYDNDGNEIGVITLSTLINSSEGFVISPGKPASLAIDFDLEASNQVTINETGDAASITVNPVLIANTSIDEDKERRVRGLLDSVDVAEQSFVVDIRPFRVRKHSYGQLTVHVNDETLYEVDGVSYRNGDGLRALAALPQFSPLVALGVYDFTEHRYLATQVYAGSSVPWDDKDAVKGSVIARSGNTLTVLGATIELKDGHFLFNDEVSIEIDEDTKVNKQGSTEAASIDDISIGQRVMILGQMTGDNTMDASNDGDIVRMRYSDISGSVVSVSPLQIDLQYINRRSVQRFDFSATGIDAANDADPQAYEVDNGTLALSQLEELAPVRVRGFPTPFGTAPADFTAKTIIDVANTFAKIYVGYGREGSANAVAALDENGLLLDLETSTGRHSMKQSGIVTDLTLLPSMPLIVPTDGHGLYSISEGHTLEVFRNWADFQAKLTDKLTQDRKVSLVTSKGQFDHIGNRIVSRSVMVRLTN